MELVPWQSSQGELSVRGALLLTVPTVPGGKGVEFPPQSDPELSMLG